MARKKPDPAAPPAPTVPPLGRIDPTPPDLLAAIRDKRCAVYVGAGLSMGAGYPGWGALLGRLIDTATRLKQVTTDHAEELRRLVAKNDGNTFLMVAQELSDRIGRSRL